MTDETTSEFRNLLSEVDLPKLANALAAVDVREPIYLIESPSPDDLYCGRNEGDALARTLSLGEIDVQYYLATNDEQFERAFDDIAIRFNSLEDSAIKMPFVHFSAHGREDGFDLTDGDYFPWEKFTRKLHYLSDVVGTLNLPPPFPPNLPRINVSLSSCSAFRNYRPTIEKDFPFQLLVGPNVDIGWCQALIGFSTFFYQAFVQKNSFETALKSMNIAAASEEKPIFEILREHDLKSMTLLAAMELYKKV